MMCSMPDTILAGLDPEQRAVAAAVRGPVCVLAGAGTGKTRAITYRIAHAIDSGAVDPRHVLAVTFTTRAAGELRARLRQLAGAGPAVERVQARTFHAAALRQLVYFWPRAVGGSAPRVIESKLSLVAEAARTLRLKLDGAALRDAASEIEWAKAIQCRPEDFAATAEKAGRVPPVAPAELANLFDSYERLRRERHVLDFESVLELTAAILADHKPAAAQVRDQYRYFVVDEYQDVNPLQKLVLDAWLGGRDDLCVVGDPYQTIYSFTGATPAFLTGFTAEFPDATVIKLVRDYRSTRQVVLLANRLIATAMPGPARPGRWRPELAAQRGDGPEPDFAEYPDEEAEAAAVAAQTRGMIDSGLPAQQIAVLVRTNAQTEIFERAMRAAGVPYAVHGAGRFFDRPEVRQALVLLRAAAKAEPSGSPLAAAGHVFAGLGLTQEPPSAGGAMRDRWEALAALAKLADEFFSAHPEAALTDFASDLTQRAADQHAPAAGGVTIASLHAAKGLEWDAVFLPALVDGILPIVYARTPDAVEEERRLLYVGLTRARSRLLLSWSLARSPDAKRPRRPSPFLGPLLPRGGGAAESSAVALPARHSATRSCTPGSRSGARRRHATAASRHSWSSRT
jgi:DNA helicase-2/ATP-dependent DNA helicase PcrA